MKTLSLRAHVAGCWAALFLSSVWQVQGPAPAFANGRPPNATSVVVNPANPQQIFVGTTFGPAISQDCGATFSWVCEGAVLPGGFAQADYNFFWGEGGVLLIQGSSASSYGGVSRSTDGGCNWTPAGEFNQLISANLSGDPLNANVIYVAANDAPNTFGYVYRSTDVGATYQPMPVSRHGIYWYSVQASAYKPQKIVAAGYDPNFVGPYIATSTDDGDTWNTVLTRAGNSNKFDVPEVTLHPTDPNLIFIAVGDISTGNAKTVLLRSSDGGVTATAVATIATQYRDMRIADDGNKMWFSTDSTMSYSSDGGQTFTLLAAPANNSCVGYNNGVTYACGNDQLDGFAVASSTDNGQTFYAGFSLASLTQAKCDASSGSTTLCTGSNPGQWGYYANLIGADGSGKPSAAEANYVPLSTYCSSACTQDGNCVPVHPTGGSTSGSTAGGHETQPSAPSTGGCSCEHVSGRTAATWLVCIAAAWAMAVRHRRVGRS